MSDTCIVCLGDLGEGAPEPAVAAAIESLPRPENEGLEANDVHGHGKSPLRNTAGVPADELSRIAHLLPCGHDLHNECLKPWVERANSCPICRQKFNVVELTEVLGGPAISSYCVQDRVQVPDVDPSMFVDDWAEGSLVQPCPICGNDDDEEMLLLCAGCDVPSHTHCLGLESVPTVPWYCHQCEAQRAASSEPPRPRNQGRTRAEQRRQRSRAQANDENWARVWHTVISQINLDLDFPFGADIEEIQQFQEAQRRELRAWERRYQVARSQGSARMFRDTAPVLLEMRRGWPPRPRPRVETPEPETLDEIRAWDAFDKAREAETTPTSNRRKRKSPTASPAEPQPAQPERRLKRPRTRRPEALAELLERGETSRPALSSANKTQSDSSGPSFLQSLLKEVEDASGPRANGAFRSTIPALTFGDMSSPRPSSPALSPASSGPSSPRLSSATPPPYNSNGPASPTPACSDVNFSSPELSPVFSPNRDAKSPDRRSREVTRPQHPRAHSSSISPPRHRSNEASPTRTGLSLSIKSDLMKMVRTALKPHYYQKVLTKDEFIDINKRISRKLYELVGPADSLDQKSRAKWEKVATSEVNNAVARLKDMKASDSGESSGAASS